MSREYRWTDEGLAARRAANSTPEAREKRRAAMKARWSDPEFRAKAEERLRASAARRKANSVSSLTVPAGSPVPRVKVDGTSPRRGDGRGA